MSLTVFSQADTKGDTSSMSLPVNIFKDIAKDLLRKDSLEEENNLLWKNSDILSNQLRLKDVLILSKDSIIGLKNQLLNAKDTVIALKEKQFLEQKELSTKLEKRIKKEKNKTFWSNISSGTVIAGLVVLLVLK